jgi:hypothetical protein
VGLIMLVERAYGEFGYILSRCISERRIDA